MRADQCGYQIVFLVAIGMIAGCEEPRTSRSVNNTTRRVLEGRGVFVTDDKGNATAAWMGVHLVPKLYWGSSFKLTDAELADLTQLKTLTALYIADEGITDAGMEHVAQMTQLEVLDLRWSKVTDRGLERLQTLKRLKVLCVANTSVTEAGIKRFRSARPDCDVRQ